MFSQPPAPPENAPAWPSRLPPGLAAALFCGALAAAWWRIPAPAESGFAPPVTDAATALPAQWTTSSLPASTAPAEPGLAQLADGRIAAVWTAGRPDDADERDIWLSILEHGAWRAPQLIANRESTAAGSFAHTGRLGWPVLYAEGGWLHLWYSSHDSLAGDSLNHSTSTDGGRNWSKPGKPEISPLAGAAVRLAAPPVAMADGGLALTLSRPFFGGHSDWLRLSATGRIAALQRLPQAVPGQASALVPLDAARALALLHDGNSGQWQTARTTDGGASWQTGATLPIANTDSRPALLRLASGRLLLAGNPAGDPTRLQLWLSGDGGLSWQAGRNLEDAADGTADLAQPALLLGRDSRIHLAYRWRQTEIRLASFSEAWLAGEQP